MPFDTSLPLRAIGLGEAISQGRDNKLKRDYIKTQTEAMKSKIGQFDLDTAAEQEVLKAARGQPYDPAVIQARDALHQSVYTDPYGRTVSKPGAGDYLGIGKPNTIGGAMGMPQRTPDFNPQANAPRGTMGGMMDGIPPMSARELPPVPDVSGVGSINVVGDAMPPSRNPASLPQIGTPNMGQLRERAAPLKVGGALAGTPLGNKMEAEAEFDIEKQRLKDANKPLNESQSNAANYATRMAEADVILKNLEGAQIDPEQAVKGSVPLIGNFLTSPNFQKSRQAQDNFLNAVLRKESGASISPDERASGNRQYFPQPGDSPEVIAQKAANRKTAISGVGIGAGPNFSLPAQEDQPTDYKSKYGLD